MHIDVSVAAFEQLTANALFRGAAYGLLGAGFAIILGVTGRFHFAFSFTYTLSAYLAFTFWDRVDLPFWPASVIGVLLATLAGLLIERFVYRPLVARAGATALLAVFVASLGIGIAGENVIRLFWSSSSQPFVGPQQKVWHFGSNINFLNLDVYQSLTGLVLVFALAALLRFSPLGRQIKATRVNPELATVIGINANTIYLVCFGIGTFFGAVAAFWYAVQYAIIPDMGQRPVIFAFVVAFLAGTARGPVRVFFTGIAVALLEQWSSMFVELRWQQTAVFVVLLGYLVSKSLQGTQFFRRLLPTKA